MTLSDENSVDKDFDVLVQALKASCAHCSADEIPASPLRVEKMNYAGIKMMTSSWDFVVNRGKRMILATTPSE